jgi:hypothetical protein
MRWAGVPHQEASGVSSRGQAGPLTSAPPARTSAAPLEGLPMGNSVPYEALEAGHQRVRWCRPPLTWLAQP